MKMIRIREAKARFSELVNCAQKGEQVVIFRYGKPVAKLIGYAPGGGKRKLGILRGKIKFHKGWDDPLPQ